jgi:hypothetical protein
MKIISTIALVAVAGCVLTAIYWVVKELPTHRDLEE